MARSRNQRFLKKVAKEAAEATVLAFATGVAGPMGGAAAAVIIKVIKKGKRS